MTSATLDTIMTLAQESGGWHWKMILMLFFLGFWLAVAVWLLFSRRGKYDLQSRMPLDDDRVLEPRDGAGGNRHGGG